MNVYEATIGDLEGIAELFNLYRMFYQQPSDPQGARDFLLERFIHKDSVIFAAVENGEYIGFTQLYPVYSSVSMKKDYILNDLYVHETARKSGAGRNLLEAASGYAKKTGAKGLSLQTAHDNLSAQSLYEKFGFLKEEQFISYYYTL
ncbi:GNAT family N-acetyltransferase [Peribacillus kribbensis]|uniref:GNAT family N-acetyltransferase n=1 Tax=Peribacillus kribbensis TaxID=356658 RepID=UPI0004032FE1|nr:GNAT family N-acetyltransferase [Peribacillus kribbensis]